MNSSILSPKNRDTASDGDALRTLKALLITRHFFVHGYPPKA